MSERFAASQRFSPPERSKADPTGTFCNKFHERVVWKDHVSWTRRVPFFALALAPTKWQNDKFLEVRPASQEPAPKKAEKVKCGHFPLLTFLSSFSYVLLCSPFLNPEGRPKGHRFPNTTPRPGHLMRKHAGNGWEDRCAPFASADCVHDVACLDACHSSSSRVFGEAKHNGTGCVKDRCLEYDSSCHACLQLMLRKLRFLPSRGRCV